ncbi:hypothetical protein MOQ_000242 [Trypanosoma cruzi marinkellei]|uniref:START domain-containing protein n=1 Tax=Trypanosoma cruzi marinkellei TaxID=85056 RepID=K2MWA9_TRYCR|nr:hypothetical protein MOQ_000242 [Trypanosoma cruzi marinkellei]
MAYLVRKTAVFSSPLGFASHKRGVPDNDEGLYREAVNFSDVEQLLLADAPATGFKLIAQDEECGISLHSRPVEDCPMHLMRAEVELPCRPAEVLAYLNVSTRRRWDDYIAELRSVRILPRPDGLLGDSNVVDVDSVAELQLQPGQRRVALYYMAIHTPILLVQNRDFEMVVAEEVRRDGTVWVKAFSTPFGYVEPLDPRQSKYVRGLMLFSGILARPVINDKGKMESHVSYVALVHPMGLVPSVLVNVVLGAQLNALKRLQRFILQHPLCTLATEMAGKETEHRTGAECSGKAVIDDRVREAAGSPSTDQSAANVSVRKKGENRNDGGNSKTNEAARGQINSQIRRRFASLRDRLRGFLQSKL